LGRTIRPGGKRGRGGTWLQAGVRAKQEFKKGSDGLLQDDNPHPTGERGGDEMGLGEEREALVEENNIVENRTAATNNRVCRKDVKRIDRNLPERKKKRKR